MIKPKALVACVVCAVICLGAEVYAAPGDQSPEGVWTEMSGLPSTGSVAAYGSPLPSEFGVYKVDYRSLDAILANAPTEFSSARTTPVVLTLPLPSGTFARFAIEESPILSPEMQAKHPDIRTYIGQGIDDPTATVRFDITSSGLRAMILSVDGTIYIDPVERGNRRYLMTFYKGSVAREADEFRCHVTESAVDISDGVSGTMVGEQLRTYRTAISATSVYTAFFGGYAGALAQIVTTLNRVTGIYERDIAVRLSLVHAVIITEAEFDPFGSSVNGVMLSTNQAVLDDSVGFGNYDIGHVFSASGGGGVASCGACRTNKAWGATSLSNPQGDIFAVDYVAHEMGHQLCASHTFNGTTGACGGGNRSWSSAYEPGSGTTIMAYAGICGSENVQSNSSDYFHARSLLQMTSYRESSGACGTVTTTGNTPPTADAGLDYTIPTNTPFVLTGSASDPDGPALTYCWEHYDLGSASPPANNADGPLFRSRPPVTSTSRTLPRITDVLSGALTPWEKLPTVDRTMKFRLSVRDNHAGGGGIDWDDMVVTVAGSPFAVTSPNGGETIAGGGNTTVTWNVGGGNVAASVDIQLSTNGGSSWSTILAGTPNDGSALATFPCAATSQGRIKIVPVGNIFFDVSNTNFTIGSPTAAVAVSATGGEFDNTCEFLVPYEATISDECLVGVDTATAVVTLLTANATLTPGPYTVTRVSPTEVTVTGSALVADPTSSPVTIEVTVTASTTPGSDIILSTTANVTNDIPPSEGGCGCLCAFQGDFDGDGISDAVDLSHLVDIVFFSGTDLMDAECPTTRGDFNSDDVTDAVDLSQLIELVYFNGPDPIDPCSL